MEEEVTIRALSFFFYILPDPLAKIIGRCTLYTPGSYYYNKISARKIAIIFLSFVHT